MPITDTNFGINPSPAQRVRASATESFKNFAGRIGGETRQPVRFDNGNLVELKPDTEYCLMLLGCRKVLTKEQFKRFVPYLRGAVTQAIADGALEEDWYQSLATVRDFIPEPIPESFLGDCENAGEEVYQYINGHLQIDIGKRPIPPPWDEVAPYLALRHLEITVGWNPLDGAVSYRAEIATKEDFKKKQHLDTDVAEAVFADLAYGTTYFVRVVALDSKGKVLKTSPVAMFVTEEEQRLPDGEMKLEGEMTEFVRNG